MDSKRQTSSEEGTSISSACKILEMVFRDAKGILLIDYLAKDKIINVPYYAKLLDNL